MFVYVHSVTMASGVSANIKKHVSKKIFTQKFYTNNHYIIANHIKHRKCRLQFHYIDAIRQLVSLIFGLKLTIELSFKLSLSFT